MILNYLLVFSVLIMSVVKTADVFIKANSELNRTQKEFIRLTKEKHNSGSISLNGCLFALMFSLLLMFFALKFKVELKEARYRRDSYLCMNYLNIKTENYIYDLTAFNWLLRSAYAAAMASPEAMVVFKSLTVARNLRHTFYLKDLFTYKYCSKEMGFNYIRNLPYKTKLAVLLETNIDETTQLREPKWTYNLMKNPSGIRFKNSFCLQSTFQMEGVMIPKTKVETRETSNTDISKLKCLSGFQ
jgi:hypothetical protein